ncbi:Gp43 (endogenous virus) [Propionibacterium phage PAD20]|uniref:Gp43 n=1 Tax=Propionibacterium phage PAD20 TaxID=504501 RepID=F4MII7_9CAUD|nr:Gp43 [Propionibacterium phage PAD20]ACX30836.1 Gp43 [Propionibacterium phage PAD20]
MQKIADHFTQLYTPASYDCPTPFDLTRLENLPCDHMDFEGLAETFRQSGKAKFHKLRAGRLIASDGPGFTQDEWKPLTGGEATQLYWNVSRINVGHLLTLCAR